MKSQYDLPTQLFSKAHFLCTAFKILCFSLTLQHIIAYPEIQFKAQTFTHDQANHKIHALGQVVVQTQQGQLFTEDVWIDTQTDQVRGQHRVILQDSQITIKADKFNYNLKTNTGSFENFLLTAKSIQVKGEKLDRLGKDHYYVTQGSYSPCRGYCKDWQISGATIDLTIEGYAWITHALVQVNEVPITYAPLVVFPVKTKRATGFIFPYFSYLNKVGSKFSFPFFVDLSPHTDLTLTPQIYPDRGHGLLTEHRYQLNKTWTGATYVDFVQETQSGQNTSLYGISTSNKIYFEENNISASLKGLSGSQPRYIQEYVFNNAYSGLSSTAQTLGVHHGRNWLDVSTRLEYSQDVMLRKRFIENPNFFVLPWIKAQTHTWKPLPWLGFSMEGEFLHSHRFSGGEIDHIPSPENIIFSGDEIASASDENPRFDENDIVITTTRSSLIPRMFTKINLVDAFRWETEFGFPYRYFVLPEIKYVTLAYPELKDTLSISFDHIYGSEAAGGVRHLLTPKITHLYRPQIIRTGTTAFFKSPNYGVSATDSIFSSHSLGMGLENAFTKKNVDSAYQTLITFGISWSVNTEAGITLEPEQTVTPVGPINTSTAIYFPYLSLYLTTSTDLNQENRTNITNTLSTSPLSWLALSIYSISEETPSSRTLQSQGGVTLSNILNLFILESKLHYSFTTDSILYHTHSLKITPPSSCWQAGITFSGPEFSTLFYFNLNFGEYFGQEKAVPFGIFEQGMTPNTTG